MTEGGIVPTLTALRIETLKRYGTQELLASSLHHRETRETRIRELAGAWAREFDAHALVVLHKVFVLFNTARDFAKIRAKVPYVLSRSDQLFPPAIGPAVMESLPAAGVDATYTPIDSDFGHLTSGRDVEK
jgi:homoserine O-acetyltransferase